MVLNRQDEDAGGKVHRPYQDQKAPTNLLLFLMAMWISSAVWTQAAALVPHGKAQTAPPARSSPFGLRMRPAIPAISTR